MKIGVFTETFAPQVNGVVTAIRGLNRELVRRGHAVTVYTVGKAGRREVADGCRVERFRSLPFLPYREYRYLVPTISSWTKLTTAGLEVLHVRSPFGFGWLAKRLAQEQGLPLVGTFDTPIEEYVHYLPLLGWTPQGRRFLEQAARRYARLFYNRCDVVVVPSLVVKQLLARQGYRRPIVVISNGVDMERFAPGRRNAALRKVWGTKPVVLHVGRITREKGVGKLVEAAGQLLDEGVEFTLVVVGKGPELARLRRLVRQRGWAGIRLAGYVPDDQLPAYYASADAFATASEVETQGIVVLEALASGLPVVGPRAGAIPEAVTGRNGLLFADAGGLREELRRVVAQDGLREELARQARRSVEQHSLPRAAGEMERLFRQLAQGR